MNALVLHADESLGLSQHYDLWGWSLRYMMHIPLTLCYLLFALGLLLANYLWSPVFLFTGPETKPT